MRLHSFNVTAVAALMFLPAASAFASVPAMVASGSEVSVAAPGAPDGHVASVEARRQSRMTRPPIGLPVVQVIGPQVLPSVAKELAGKVPAAKAPAGKVSAAKVPVAKAPAAKAPVSKAPAAKAKAPAKAPKAQAQAPAQAPKAKAPAQAPKAQAQAPAAQSSAAQAFQDRVLVLTNAERRRNGLASLTFSRCADGFADSWAPRLRTAGGLSHQNLATVVSACAASSAGENVAFGNVTPERLLAMWMGSPGHRANILSPNFTHLGVGAAQAESGRWYGVQVFLR